MAKDNLCSAQCRHLRSFRYGFDNSKILAPYNGKDHLAGCVLQPERTIHLRAVPVCTVVGQAKQEGL